MENTRDFIGLGCCHPDEISRAFTNFGGFIPDYQLHQTGLLLQSF
jgi:hypothetical protein